MLTNASRRSLTANASLGVTINNAAANPDMSPTVSVNVDYGLFVFDNFNNQNGPLFTIIFPNYATFVFLQNSDTIKILSLIFTAAGQPLAQPTGSNDPNVTITPWCDDGICGYSSNFGRHFCAIPKLRCRCFQFRLFQQLERCWFTTDLHHLFVQRVA